MHRITRNVPHTGRAAPRPAQPARPTPDAAREKLEQRARDILASPPEDRSEAEARRIVSGVCELHTDRRGISAVKMPAVARMDLIDRIAGALRTARAGV
jgi:hypothetical protein